MKVSEVCKRTGLSIKTVRFYESQGLIQPAAEERNGKQWRDYSEADVARLAVIAELRRALFPVADIQQMLTDPQEVEPLLAAHRVRIEKMYQDLASLRVALEQAEHRKPEGPAELAAALAESETDMPLPAIDLAPHFKELDEEEAKLIPPPGKPQRPKVITKGVLIFGAVLVLASLVLSFFQYRSYSRFELESVIYQRTVHELRKQSRRVRHFLGSDGSEFTLYNRSIRGYRTGRSFYFDVPTDQALEAEAASTAGSLGITGLDPEEQNTWVDYLFDVVLTHPDGSREDYTLLSTRSGPRDRSGSVSIQNHDLYLFGFTVGDHAITPLFREHVPEALEKGLLEIDRRYDPYVYRAEGMSYDAAAVTAAIFCAADTRTAGNVYLTHLAEALFLTLLVIGGRVLVPSLLGVSSKNKGEKMLGYATMYAMGNVAMGAKGTAHVAVHQSPMEASMVLDRDKEKEEN